ncbi:MAG: hypothetical protein IT328_22985 [Caldilineaceae bacterium]|nr:hypothetical protein [Caldilineaceae bacterium]
MITILIVAFLGMSALCTLVLVCACIVSRWADERAPHPPVAESWEGARSREEVERGVILIKYFRA